jgi:hypothetical protein
MKLHKHMAVRYSTKLNARINFVFPNHKTYLFSWEILHKIPLHFMVRMCIICTFKTNSDLAFSCSLWFEKYGTF